MAELAARRPALTDAGAVATHGPIADDVTVTRILNQRGELITALAARAVDAVRGC